MNTFITPRSALTGVYRLILRHRHDSRRKGLALVSVVKVLPDLGSTCIGSMRLFPGGRWWFAAPLDVSFNREGIGGSPTPRHGSFRAMCSVSEPTIRDALLPPSRFVSRGVGRVSRPSIHMIHGFRWVTFRYPPSPLLHSSRVSRFVTPCIILGTHRPVCVRYGTVCRRNKGFVLTRAQYIKYFSEA